MNTLTYLYKSLTPIQFAAVVNSGWKEFSIESPEQKIFYPKLHREYAEMIARKFNLEHYHGAYVVEFKVDSTFISRYDIQSVAYDEHKEYKVPVEELPLLNKNLIGTIQVVSAFTKDECDNPSSLKTLSWFH